MMYKFFLIFYYYNYYLSFYFLTIHLLIIYLSPIFLLSTFHPLPVLLSFISYFLSIHLPSFLFFSYLPFIHFPFTSHYWDAIIVSQLNWVIRKYKYLESVAHTLMWDTTISLDIFVIYMLYYLHFCRKFKIYQSLNYKWNC